jgi:hypothetical protein
LIIVFILFHITPFSLRHSIIFDAAFFRHCHYAMPLRHYFHAAPPLLFSSSSEKKKKKKKKKKKNYFAAITISCHAIRRATPLMPFRHYAIDYAMHLLMTLII